MTRRSSSIGVLAVALTGTLWSTTPGRTADACALLTKAELETAFGEPLNEGAGSTTPGAASCTFMGRERFSFIVMVGNSTLPAGFELARWRAQYKTTVQNACREAQGETMKRVNFQVVRDLGEEAYACSHDIYAGPTQMGAVTWLHAAKGPNILQISVPRRERDTLQKLSGLVGTAFSRLPQ